MMAIEAASAAPYASKNDLRRSPPPLPLPPPPSSRICWRMSTGLGDERDESDKSDDEDLLEDVHRPGGRE